MTRPMPEAVLAVLEARGHLIDIPMVWFSSRDRETHEVHGIGIWGGEDAENILVQDMFTGVGATRTFYNGGLLEVGSVRHQVGLEVQSTTITLSGIDTAVLIAFRQYEARGAEVQIWRRSYDPETRLPIAVRPWFKGFVDSAPTERPEAGSESSMAVEVVSTARLLTIASAGRKSHEAQRKRMGDMFRQHKGTIGNRVVPWGENDVRHEQK